MNKPIVNFEDKLYVINKVLTIKKDPPFDLVEELQHYYHSNKVLKKENKYYFVTQIEEPILENYGEITTTEDRPSVDNSSN